MRNCPILKTPCIRNKCLSYQRRTRSETYYYDKTEQRLTTKEVEEGWWIFKHKTKKTVMETWYHITRHIETEYGKCPFIEASYQIEPIEREYYVGKPRWMPERKYHCYYYEEYK